MGESHVSVNMSVIKRIDSVIYTPAGELTSDTDIQGTLIAYSHRRIPQLNLRYAGSIGGNLMVKVSNESFINNKSHR